MRSAAAGPEPVLRPTEVDIELRYYNTIRVQELLGLVQVEQEHGPQGACGGEEPLAGAAGYGDGK